MIVLEHFPILLPSNFQTTISVDVVPTCERSDPLFVGHGRSCGCTRGIFVDLW